MEKAGRRLHSVDCLETTLNVDVESQVHWRCGGSLGTPSI